MKVLFNYFSREYHSIKNEIDTAVKKVMNSGYFVLGRELEAFERRFAQYCGTKFCLGVASGTDALILALKSLGIGHGDFVMTVSHTAVPTVSAISMCGAEPVFVDINEKTLLMDPDILEDRIKKLPKKLRKKLKAVIAVHLYGAPCPISNIKEITDRFGLKLIEDCAQSHGAAVKDKKSGTTGCMGCFSFYPTKNLGCYGDGGAIITDSEFLYEKLVKLRNHGQGKRYYHTMKGLTSRLDEIQSAILNVKLSYLDKWNKRRLEIHSRYRNAFCNLPFGFQEVVPNSRHVYHLSVLLSKKRNALKKYLTEQKVQTFIHYPIPVHLQKSYKYLGYKKGDLPATEKTAEQLLSLPVSPFLKEKEINFVIHKTKEFSI